jgi:hypothetical protein
MVAGALLWEVVVLRYRQQGARETVRQHRLIHGNTHDTSS